LEQEFEIVATTRDGRELVAAIEALNPEVTVADISMPLLNGLDALRQSKSAHSSARFVFPHQSGRGSGNPGVPFWGCRLFIEACHRREELVGNSAGRLLFIS
jgi:hypothetical protein